MNWCCLFARFFSSVVNSLYFANKKKDNKYVYKWHPNSRCMTYQCTDKNGVFTQKYVVFR